MPTIQVYVKISILAQNTIICGSLRVCMYVCVQFILFLLMAHLGNVQIRKITVKYRIIWLPTSSYFVYAAYRIGSNYLRHYSLPFAHWSRNIKMPSYQFREYPYKDKTVLSLNGNFHTWKVGFYIETGPWIIWLEWTPWHYAWLGMGHPTGLADWKLTIQGDRNVFTWQMTHQGSIFLIFPTEDTYSLADGHVVMFIGINNN